MQKKKLIADLNDVARDIEFPTVVVGFDNFSSKLHSAVASNVAGLIREWAWDEIEGQFTFDVEVDFMGLKHLLKTTGSTPRIGRVPPLFMRSVLQFSIDPNLDIGAQIEAIAAERDTAEEWVMSAKAGMVREGHRK